MPATSAQPAVLDRVRFSAHQDALCINRSERWLLENLDQRQREQYRRWGAFVVEGKRRQYVITAYGVSDDRGVHYCINARGFPGDKSAWFPIADRAVGLLLLIKFNERKFRRTAHLFCRSKSGVHPLVDPEHGHAPKFRRTRLGLVKRV
jgi:hypothetical protein